MIRIPIKQPGFNGRYPAGFFHCGTREVANGETRKLKRARRREMLVMKIRLPYNPLGFPKTYPIASMGLVYLPRFG